jgi:hypothetical protein
MRKGIAVTEPPSTGYPFTSNGNGWAQRNADLS